MANFKYKKPRSGRAGCHMCKPQKIGWVNPDKESGHRGFSNIRKLITGNDDYIEWMKEYG